MKFELRSGKEKAEAFLLRRRGKFYAYLNRCRHVPLPLDFGDNDFLTEDGKLILCRNHGAVYKPETGECLAGPCAGLALQAVALRVEKGGVYCADAVWRLTG